ncbi:Thymidylate kinase [Bienertia sinuspersici]
MRVKNNAGVVVIVDVKYERLPTFCYACRFIGHIERDCEVAIEENNRDQKQWGSWLRASLRKGRLKMQEETKNFINNRKVLVMREGMSPQRTHVVQKEQASKHSSEHGVDHENVGRVMENVDRQEGDGGGSNSSNRGGIQQIRWKIPHRVALYLLL